MGEKNRPARTLLACGFADGRPRPRERFGIAQTVVPVFSGMILQGRLR